tara:strand:+ start:1946 stop:4261 length:2316 start_codon:yes stop_codon:yes gene_type:complete
MDTKRIKVEKIMSLGNWLAEQIINEDSKIKTVVAIYPGRFQPMGAHHAKAYKWLQSKFKDAYVGTSGKVDLPKSPFSFNEKKKIINSHGISKVVQVKNPYKAEEILKKYDPETTAAVFMVGEKDAGRLKGKFFQPWKGNADVGYRDGAYLIIAPHVSMNVPGYGEMSGTAIRKALGDIDLDKKQKIKIFKGIFGHTKNYDLITKKLEKLNEVIEGFCAHFDIPKLLSENVTATGGDTVDDGPRGYWGNQSSWKKFGKDIQKYINPGMEVLNYLTGDEEFFNHDTEFKTDMSGGPTGAVSYWPVGVPGSRSGTNLLQDKKGRVAYDRWVKWSRYIATSIGYEFVSFLGAEISSTSNPAEPTKSPKPGALMKEGLLLEGGAYGHMAHPFDDKGLTFGDFRQIIDISLQGKLNLESAATEKTDGQNLFITWNKKLLAARNTGDIKRGGIDSSAIAKKFSGRGNIEKAFNYAMNDLSKAIKSLNEKQLKKIFDNGKNWINMEIMYPASSNVINYDAPHLQFHNVLKYKDGAPIGSVPDGARILAGMIAQVNQSVQKSFTIIGPQFLKVNPHQDYSAKKPYFLTKLNSLMKKFSMSDSSTFGEYHQAWWGSYVDKNFKGIDNTIKMGLVKRWAFSDKSFRLNKKTMSDEKLLSKAIDIDKQKHAEQVKKNMLPFEKLFFELGAEVLKNAEGFLAANPDKAVQNIRKQIKQAISIVKKGGDIKKINRLAQQLNKLNSIGGMDSIVPSEGLVFVYKGKTYKLTGAFAPVNQITGMIYF